MANRFYRRPRHRADAGAAGQHLRRRRQRIAAHVPRHVFRDLILQLLLEAPDHSLPSREVRRMIGSPAALAERLEHIVLTACPTR